MIGEGKRLHFSAYLEFAKKKHAEYLHFDRVHFVHYLKKGGGAHHLITCSPNMCVYRIFHVWNSLFFGNVNLLFFVGIRDFP